MQVAISFALWLFGLAAILAGSVMAIVVLMYTWFSILLYNPSAAAAIAALLILIGLIIFLSVKD